MIQQAVGSDRWEGGKGARQCMRSVVAVVGCCEQTSGAASAEHIHRQTKVEGGDQSIRDAEQGTRPGRQRRENREVDSGGRRSAYGERQGRQLN